MIKINIDIRFINPNVQLLKNSNKIVFYFILIVRIIYNI